ncbi:hypothetical protein MUK70_06705 [Dyadobacter chenwenxiniae]|uniref:Uncharacterized protein n=1 Tax=Dyadobacter chenwenxiniae TaxID=2906456 RepID=A0A9X1PKM4_9BACT|nr:hypothetical protein [Dyadobacter chenwenxiniae]MCF0050680.1 hypothetical protein [Dyadobacter chenwenxiniae]MCF0063157.1 hypothetical protein [Dyadobacter chenwenxiniae]UON84676.1 hypothetical protein MUK70_06705 [Dyadobacter chenwenxiniae]
MKIKTIGILTMLGLLSITLPLAAQVVSKDSLNMLKEQKENIEISKKLNERKLELAKLENELESATREVEKTAEQAQRSADDNQKNAERLGSDPQDKKLARRAGNSASGARKDAKRARKASDHLDDLKKDIESLRRRIADDEAKLANMQGGASSN